MQNAKETASNIAASAKAGMDKTKAVVQEKVEKITAHDPIEKDMATQRKEEKIVQAEINKQQTREHNAATTGHGHATGGVPGTGGMHMPGHGTGHILSGHETTGTGGIHGHSAMPGHHGTGHTLGTGTGGTHASGFGTGTGTGGTHGTTGHGIGGRVAEGIEKATGIGSGTTGHNTHGTHPSGYGTYK
ncbi:unnamed protein product [Rhodiola kirilowii]